MRGPERKGGRSQRQIWRPGNMLYPVPAVMVSAADGNGGSNIITVAWAGTVCSDPVMLSISVRPERYSYDIIRTSGEFVVNLTTRSLARAADYCGVRSGRDVDKWKECSLTAEPAQSLKYAPSIKESPVNIECRVIRTEKLGSHHMFLAEVTAVWVDDSYLDEKGKFELKRTGLLAYSHGEYLGLGKKLGTFGYSVRKKKTAGKKSTGRKNANRKRKNGKKN